MKLLIVLLISFSATAYDYPTLIRRCDDGSIFVVIFRCKSVEKELEVQLNIENLIMKDCNNMGGNELAKMHDFWGCEKVKFILLGKAFVHPNKYMPKGENLIGVHSGFNSQASKTTGTYNVGLSND